MSNLFQLFEFPSSMLLAVSLLLIAFLLHSYCHGKVVQFLASERIARMLLIVGALLLAIEGTWSVPIHTSSPFAIYLILLLLSLALTILNAIKDKRKVGFIFNHLGIFLIIWASFFGAPDVTRAKMILYEGESSDVAYCQDGLLVPLPFSVALEDFQTEYYDDGKSPKQFYSQLLVDGKKMTTSVNHPCTHQGYSIFQSGYDQEQQRYSVLQIVRTPWLPIIYLGMVLLAIGSILLLFSKWNLKWCLPIVIVLALIFTIATLLKINFGTLMPALRSWWFVPHLLIYMVAYALMTFALIMWIIEKKKFILNVKFNVSEYLIRSSSALLIIGMLCGSVWAWQAWGDYWGWDSKENWAAVTWFLTLVYLHNSKYRSSQSNTITWKAFGILLIAFLALQITWYGVNYLPSASMSLHTYMM